MGGKRKEPPAGAGADDAEDVATQRKRLLGGAAPSRSRNVWGKSKKPHPIYGSRPGGSKAPPAGRASRSAHEAAPPRLAAQPDEAERPLSDGLAASPEHAGPAPSQRAFRSTSQAVRQLIGDAGAAGRGRPRPREEDIEPELASEDDDDAPPGPAPPAATPRAAVSLHESAPADVAGQDAGASPEVPALPKSAPPAARPSGLMSQQRAFLQSNAPKAGAGLRPGGLSHLGVGGQSLCARMRGVESGIRKLEARLEQRAPRGSIPSPPPKTAGREAAAAPFVARVVATSWMTTHLAVHCVPVAVLEAQVQWVIGAQHSSADRDAGSEGSAQQKSQASQRGQPARAALDGSTSVVVLVPAATARKLEVLEGGRIAVQAPWCVVLGAGDPGVAVVLGHLFEVGR